MRAARTSRRGDRQEIAFLRGNVAPGQTALDVGANKGAYTWWLARAVGRRGRVVAFEPQPDLARRLRRAVRGRSFRHVRVEAVALSDRSGEGSLHTPGAAHWEATLEARAPRAGSVSRAVPVWRLDEFLPRLGLERVDFIKIDVEGHELAVLHGAAAVLARDRPTLLLECEGRHRADGDVSVVFDHLAARGYRGAWFGAAGLRPLEEFDPRRHQVPGQVPYANNFVFRPAP
jgi:FkbM family methyltransferase